MRTANPAFPRNLFTRRGVKPLYLLFSKSGTLRGCQKSPTDHPLWCTGHKSRTVLLSRPTGNIRCDSHLRF